MAILCDKCKGEYFIIRVYLTVCLLLTCLIIIANILKDASSLEANQKLIADYNGLWKACSNVHAPSCTCNITGFVSIPELIQGSDQPNNTSGTQYTEEEAKTRGFIPSPHNSTIKVK